MRRPSATALLTAIVLISLILLRHHLRDITDVASTYATFYRYIHEHPDTLYRYRWPTSDSVPKLEHGTALVPRNLHQIFLTQCEDLDLSRYSDAIASCQNLHPNWTHRIWTAANSSAFLGQNYPQLMPHYQNYKQHVQRADLLRYALLDHFGGVYLDLDVTCLRPLDELQHLPWLTPAAHPAGVNNAFILSRPHHSFLQLLLDRAGSRDLSWGLPYVETMLSAGCMFLSNMWMSYVRSLGQRGVDVPFKDRVYVLADEQGHVRPHMLRGAVTTPLFRHGGASSWHQWDAAAIVMIGKHLVLLAVLVVGALIALVATWRMSRRPAIRRQQWRPLIPGLSGSEEYGEDALVGFKDG